MRVPGSAVLYPRHMKLFMTHLLFGIGIGAFHSGCKSDYFERFCPQWSAFLHSLMSETMPDPDPGPDPVDSIFIKVHSDFTVIRRHRQESQGCHGMVCSVNRTGQPVWH